MSYYYYNKYIEAKKYYLTLSGGSITDVNPKIKCLVATINTEVQNILNSITVISTELKERMLRNLKKTDKEFTELKNQRDAEDIYNYITSKKLCDTTDSKYNELNKLLRFKKKKEKYVNTPIKNATEFENLLKTKSIKTILFEEYDQLSNYVTLSKSIPKIEVILSNTNFDRYWYDFYLVNMQDDREYYKKKIETHALSSKKNFFLFHVLNAAYKFQPFTIQEFLSNIYLKKLPNVTDRDIYRLLDLYGKIEIETGKITKTVKKSYNVQVRKPGRSNYTTETREDEIEVEEPVYSSINSKKEKIFELIKEELKSIQPNQ